MTAILWTIFLILLLILFATVVLGFAVAVVMALVNWRKERR